jgi:glycosyltransferase involved in cell wall biosynthesis
MAGRVLVVSYNFPPLGGVGIQRTLKYATYLPRWGWEPVVLTARNPGAALRDDDTSRSVPPGLLVERAFCPEPVKLRHALGGVARKLRGHGGRAPAEAPAAAGTTADGSGAARGSGAAGRGSGTVARSHPRLAARLGPAWAAAMRLAFFPDEQIGWVPFAARLGCGIHRRSPVDAVYSTFAPVSSHLAAARIAGRTGLPWIADFRDPWIGNAYVPPRRGLYGYLQRRIERRIVERADRLVFATQGFLDGYAERYPWAANKMRVIPNGYDRADIPAPAAHDRGGSDSGRFRIAFGGSVYGEHELEIFLDGLELLVARRPEIRDRLEVEFIGWLSLHNQDVAARYLSPERLGSMVRFTGFLPHREAVARMASADALLQLVADGPNKAGHQGGKLLEYLGLDRQILAVVPEGKARELLRELDWGVVADPTPEGVAGGVERLLAGPAPNRPADPTGRYDRVNLAGQLAALLDEITGTSVGRGPSGT